MSKPTLFVSAVSREFHSARERIASILRRRGFEVIYQPEFGTEHGDLRPMLHRKLAACVGLIQIAGDAYGAEPPEPDKTFGRCSYTQFEFLTAHSMGKKTWLIVAGPGIQRDTQPDLLDLSPTDHARWQADPTAWQAKRRQFQAAYRERPEVREHLHYTAESDLELELCIERLEDKLEQLRREARRSKLVALLIAAAILLLLGKGLGLQVWTKSELQHQGKVLGGVKSDTVQLLAAQRELPKAFADAQPWSNLTVTADDEEGLFKGAYALLAEKHHVAASQLEKELPLLATKLLADENTPPFDRAAALFLQKRYPEAEKQALVAGDGFSTGANPSYSSAADALLLAGFSANLQQQPETALAHFRAAEVFAVQAGASPEIARVSQAIARTSGKTPVSRSDTIDSQLGSIAKGVQEVDRKVSAFGPGIGDPKRLEELVAENAKLKDQLKQWAIIHRDYLHSQLQIGSSLLAQWQDLRKIGEGEPITDATKTADRILSFFTQLEKHQTELLAADKRIHEIDPLPDSSPARPAPPKNLRALPSQ